MTDAVIQALPEQGQLVEVRQRKYVVMDVTASMPLATPLHPGNGAHHLVSLTSVEDDALGEELQVVWEIEPGAQVYERAALPSPKGFDTPRRFDAFLSAARWGAISSADINTLQAPFRSGVDIEEYQLDPTARAILMPRVNLLIADDVGLGKTIETGLVIQEMILRYRARRILIVCPSALQIQWRDQMRDKFGLEFRIVDSQLMRELRRTRGIHARPWSHFPRLITSIDFLKRDRPLRMLREELPAEGELAYPRRFDLLVVDEAHNIAPAGRGRYAIDSDRTAAIRLLAPHFEHKLFLTATPHNGYSESFSALLELLDNQRFARGVPPNPSLLNAVMVRRLKTEIKDEWGVLRFPKPELKVLEVPYTAQERQAHAWLQEYTESRQKHVEGSSALERTATEFVLKLLKKRMFSSPAAFAGTLGQHEHTLGEATKPARDLPKPTLSVLKAQVEPLDDDYVDDEEYEDAAEQALRMSARLLAALTPRERELLANLRQWAARASAAPDSKAQALMQWLHQQIKPGGVWSEERVIIFTEYRDTQKWLQKLLAAEKLTESGRMLLLYGGMDAEQREEIKAAFQADPKESPVRILLATDAASEGIDLQLHCHRLVHYEIPFNPNRMEQRNGRIDRHGQKQTPLIYHFAPEGIDPKALNADIPVGKLEGDLEFLMRVVLKVEQIREDLGKVGPVIADQVTEAMLGKRRSLDTWDAEQAARPIRELLKFEKDLGVRLHRLREQMEETRHALDLTPEHVLAAIAVALELAGLPPLREATVEGIWPDPTGERTACPVYYLPPLRGSWARCAEGLPHPHTGKVRPLVFDHNLARGRDDVVLVHLNHRLAQMALRLLRAEVWNTDATRQLNRVTARTVPDHLLSTPAVIGHARLVVVGGNRTRLHEEVIVAGGEITDGRRFRRMNVGETQRLLDVERDAEPSQPVKDRLRGTWPAVEGSLHSALEARSAEKLKSLEHMLDERRAKEEADIRAILAELERRIREELDTQPQYIQLELFSTSELEQYSRNVAALRARLDEIPHELEHELKAIRTRYDVVQPRLFPMAVTFLVPARLAR
jgi:superfamily II DNA or RNA helicase